MRRLSTAVGVLLLLAGALAGCKSERAKPATGPEGFAFTVYPGSQYLAQLTELDKRAAAIVKPTEPPPPIAIYDTDAPLDTVANFYLKAYGFSTIAPDATNNLSAVKPPAYYRSGDLAADTSPIGPLLQKLNVKADLSKAQGTYRAVEMQGTPNRPRVTLQRPYFDVTKSQVVDRTMILMAP